MTEYRRESDVKGEIFAWVSLLLGLCMVRCGMIARHESEAEHGDSPYGGQKDRKCPPRDEPSRM